MFDHTLLAENIKKHRLANRLTQTQLAEMTNVSCQAISKWERGIAIPELDKLCLLADAFHCTVDRLIGNVQTGQKMLMGVDGGGSKTEFVLLHKSSMSRGQHGYYTANFKNVKNFFKIFKIIFQGGGRTPPLL